MTEHEGPFDGDGPIGRRLEGVGLVPLAKGGYDNILAMKNPLENLIDSLAAHLPRPVHLPYGVLPPVELPLTTEYDLNALPSSPLRAVLSEPSRRL